VQPSLPRWDLRGLYASPTDPAIDEDLARGRAEADAFAAQWEGRVGDLDGDALLTLLRDYESLLGRVYRPQLYAQLVSATATLDEAVRAAAARIGEGTTAALNRVRFVDVEIGRAPQSAHDRWAAHPPLTVYGHFLARARAAAPHTLAVDVESALASKDLTGRRAWSQLYNERCAAWRFTLPGREETLNLAEVRSLREDAHRAPLFLRW
jgi:oligoendopeptidase F